MYPPQTSLVPVTVAITRYVETKGFNGNYPYWYLGTTPTNYLTGPLVPQTLIFIKKIFNLQNFFEASYLLILTSFIVSFVGWFILVKALTKNSKIAIITTGFLVVFPWRYFYSLALSDLSFVVARNFLPFLLIFFLKYFKLNHKKYFLITVGYLTFLVLIDPTIFVDVMVSFLALSVFISWNKAKKKFVNFIQKIKKSFLVIFLGYLLSTTWYRPEYWLTILTNPSIGGVSGFGAFLRIFDLVKAMMPVLFAIVIVYFSHRFRSRFVLFTLVWLFSFLFLSAFRFISDYDFWQDWSTWIYELEIGVSLLFAYILYKKRYFVIPACVLLIAYVVTLFFYRKLGMPKLISPEPPAYMNSIEKLNKLAEGNNFVFISGSSVWWANAFYDVRQVRGGVDRVSVDSRWPKAAWVFRESPSVDETKEYLDDLGVDYVLVHTGWSSEYFHDFKHLAKWEALGQKIWSQNGDTIYNYEVSN